MIVGVVVAHERPSLWCWCWSVYVEVGVVHTNTKVVGGSRNPIHPRDLSYVTVRRF